MVQRPFLRGLFFLGGAYIWRGLSTERNLRFKIGIIGSKFLVFALFYFVFESNFPSTSPRGGGGGAYIWRGDLTEGFLALPVWGAHIWRGLYMEGLIFRILRYYGRCSLINFHWYLLLNCTGVFCVMFNKRVGVFYTPIKNDPRVSMELITMTLFWTLQISIRKKKTLPGAHTPLLCKKIKSYTCLEIFQSTNDTNRRGHSVLFQSFSGA